MKYTCVVRTLTTLFIEADSEEEAIDIAGDIYLDEAADSVDIDVAKQE